MTLDKTNWAVRYYIFLLKIAGNETWSLEWRLSRVNNLCQFARALVFRTIGLVIACLFALFLLYGLAVLLYLKPLVVVGVLAMFAAGSVGVVGATLVVRTIGDRVRNRQPKPPGIVRTYVGAIKRGICPLVSIENDMNR